MASHWNYGGLVVENFFYGDKEIGIVDFEKDDELDKYKEFLKAKQKIEISYKSQEQLKIITDIDDYDDSETNTLIINGDFTIKPDGKLIEDIGKDDDHAYFDPPPKIHTTPAIKFPSAEEAIKDIQTITFTPTGYSEKGEN